MPPYPLLWAQKSRPISFTLCVDDFGIQYIGPENAEKLLNALRTRYTVTTYWTGTLFLGITLKLKYKTGTVYLSMPGYIRRTLEQFQHPIPPQPEDSPYSDPNTKWVPYLQLTAPEDKSKRLDAEAVNRLQQFIDTLLYYDRAVDPTMVKALGSLASQQSEETDTTAKRITQLLNYAASNPDTTTRYSRSGMVLHISSDTSYLSEPKARSCVGVHFFLDNKHVGKDITRPKLNGPVHTVSNILRNVMSSAGEAKVAALFHNCKDSIMLRNALVEMGYPQPPTPVQTDNSFSEGFSNRQVKQRQSKAIDMPFY